MQHRNGHFHYCIGKEKKSIFKHDIWIQIINLQKYRRIKHDNELVSP